MTIRIEGLDKLLAKLTRLEQMARVKDALRSAAVHMRQRVAQYPPASHRPQPIGGEGDERKRRLRGFFYHLNKGDIEVPYKRGSSPGSERLSGRWTIESRDDGLTQVIGNNASYGPLVMGPDKQTKYHAATGWPTTDKVTTKEKPVVVEYLRRAVQKEIDSG